MGAIRQFDFNEITREQSIGVHIIRGVRVFATSLDESPDQEMPGQSFLGVLEN